MIDYSDFKFEMQSKMPGYKAFENSKHSDAAFMDLCRGTIKRLIHSRPSQHGKSSDTDLVIAYMYGLNPLLKAICATYSQHLARRHSRNVKRLLQSPEFFEVFGWRPSYLKETEDEWQLNWPGVGQGSSFLARSIESPALGKTADLLVIDNLPLAGSLAGSLRAEADEGVGVYLERAHAEAHAWSQGARHLHALDPAGPEHKAHGAVEGIQDSFELLQPRCGHPHGRASFRQDIVTGETTYIEPYEVLWPEWKDFDFIQTKRLEMLPEDFETQYQGNPVAGGGSLCLPTAGANTHELPELEYAFLVCDTGMEREKHTDPSTILACGAGTDGFACVRHWREGEGRWTMKELLWNCYDLYDFVARKVMHSSNPAEARARVPRSHLREGRHGRSCVLDHPGAERHGPWGFLPVATCKPELTKPIRARAQSHKIQGGPREAAEELGACKGVQESVVRVPSGPP